MPITGTITHVTMDYDANRVTVEEVTPIPDGTMHLPGGTISFTACTIVNKVSDEPIYPPLRDGH